MGIRGKAWTEQEDDLLRQHYETLGAAGMHARRAIWPTVRWGRSPSTRTGSGWCTSSTQPEVLTPIPRMDLIESQACITARKWRGPVTPGLVGWRLAA
jgi:hypothetical protein